MAANFSYLSDLTVSLRSDSATGLIYANSRNQVEVIVNFIALNNRGEQVFLTDEQKQDTISLCDYYTGKPIDSDDWAVSQEAGEFVSDGILLDHESSYTTLSQENKGTSPAGLKSGLGGYLLPQSYSLWVSVNNGVFTTKSFAAEIFDGDNKTYSSTIFGDFESCITLTPVVEKTYVKEDIFLSNDAEIENIWDYQFSTDIVYKHCTYLSFLQNYLFMKKIEGIPDDTDTLMCKNYTPWKFSTRFVYIDGRNSGIRSDYTSPDGTVYSFLKNLRTDYLCCTLISYSTAPQIPNNFYEPVVITVYDQYGNKGRFQIGINDLSANQLKIKITDA